MVITSYFFKCHPAVWGFPVSSLVLFLPLGPMFRPLHCLCASARGKRKSGQKCSTWLAWSWRIKTSPGHLGVQ